MKFLLKFWPVLALLILSSFIVWPLFLPGYFSHHDDLQVMRIFEMRKCLEDFQIPCRWVPDMGFGNGYPLFNYYGILPYYIGAFFSFLVGFIGAAKILFFIPLVLGGLSMYFLAAELFGTLPGFVSAVLFLLAPYRALDSYVRGDITESWAIALAPLMFLFLKRVLDKGRKQDLGLGAVSVGFFLLCHNLMTLLFMPLLGLWIIFWICQGRKFILPAVLTLTLGLGLSAFFILPALFEQSLVQINTLTILGSDFHSHFATLNQLFLSRFWGYGESVFGPNDTISFQIGWPLWWLAAVSLGVAGWKKNFLLIFLGVVFLGAIVMTHDRSTFIWDSLPFLKFMQFPWRFLAVVIFAGSILGGGWLSYLKGKVQIIAGIVSLLLAFFLNWYFFRPSTFFPQINDIQKLSGELWQQQQKAGILDYLPITATEPKGPAPNKPEIKTGSAQVSDYIFKSSSFSFKADIKKSANIEVPVFDFPNWITLVNNQEIVHSHHNSLGRIRLDLPPGNYQIKGEFRNTPIRAIANFISVLSLLYLIYLIVFKKKYD